MERQREQTTRRSEESTPSDVHRCQVLLIGSLYDQLIDLTIHRKWNGLFRHESSELGPNVFQNAGWRIRDIGMSAALQGEPYVSDRLAWAMNQK